MESTTQTGSFWMPPQASTTAAEVDSLFDFIMDLNYIFFAIIFAMTVYFVVKYRKTDENPIATSDFDHSTLWEGAWAFIPLLLCFVVFFWGFKVFLTHTVSPDNAMEINVTAQKWSWSFKYDDGQNTSDLYVPAGQPVKLIMKSKDVLHSFFVPDFRVKSDVLPGRYTTVWFEAMQPGVHRIYCTEYCGKDHSGMYRTVTVLSAADFAKKKSAGFEGRPEGQDPAIWGKELYSKYGCNACHGLTEGEVKVGPTFYGIFGRKGETTAGESYVANEEYIRESIMEPMAKIVKGYAPQMPSFKDQIGDDQMDALIAFMKTLK
jgi:cytochrome c oxidase subunit 2